MKKRVLIVLILMIVFLIIFEFFNNNFLNRNLFTGFVSFQGSFLDNVVMLVSMGKLFIDILEGPFIITIYSPQNITYNFTVNDSVYTIWLNVSSNRNISLWWYDLKDLKHGISRNSTFIPNTTFDAYRWWNEMTVFAIDSLGNIKNASVVFFVYVPDRAPLIVYLAPQMYACENSYLSSSYGLFYVDDFDEDIITPHINPTNPFFIRHFPPDINLTRTRHLIYSGYLDKNNAGGINNGYNTFVENVSVEDGTYSDSRIINITVIEINNAPEISPIGTHTIWSRGENTNFYYQVHAEDIEDGNQDSGNLNFSIFFAGQFLFNISSKSGIMNFTANSSHIGVHNITVCVKDQGIRNPHSNISICGQDGGSITTCDYFNLVVTNQNRPPMIISYYPLNLSFKANSYQILYFNLTKYDPDGPPIDTYWYVDGILEQYNPYNPNRSNFDEFIYRFGCGLSGVHDVKAVVSDGELNASVQWNITVNYDACPVNAPPKGGGGVGGGILFCNENWGCSEWSQCQNLKNISSTGRVTHEIEYLIKQRCLLFKWKDDVCGLQTRECNELNHCWTNTSKPGVIQECYFTEFPTCNDGIKNCHGGSCEVLVDCGGPCTSCPSCSNNIKDQGEEGIDCGGPCPSCKIEAPKPVSPVKGILVYSLFSIFLLVLILISRMLVKYYQNKKRLEEITKRKNLLRRDELWSFNKS